jgi:hypothetical protein
MAFAFHPFGDLRIKLLRKPVAVSLAMGTEADINLPTTHAESVERSLL